MRVLVITPQRETSSRVNVIVPLKYLSEHHGLELDIALEREVTPPRLLDADLIAASRSVDPDYKPIYELAQQLGIPIIYDLDDNLFEVPATSSLYPYFRNPTKLAQVEWMLRAAWRVRAHSPVLQQVLSHYNPRTHLAWGAVEWSLAPSQLPPVRANPIDIVYAASSYSGEMFFALILPDIQRLLEHYGSRIRLCCLGYHPPQLRGHPQVVFTPFETDYETFFSTFTRHGYAIGLAPMLDDLFYQCKTNLKYRDYAAAGAAGVYSDTPLYQSSIVHGKTGLLAPNQPDAWFNALSQLIENPALIAAIRQEARRAVEARYNLETAAHLWLEDLQAAPPRPPLSGAARRQVEAMTWWFNRPPKPDGRLTAQARRLYHRTVPFRLHVLLSRGYHRLKRYFDI